MSDSKTEILGMDYSTKVLDIAARMVLGNTYSGSADDQEQRMAQARHIYELQIMLKNGRKPQSD